MTASSTPCLRADRWISAPHWETKVEYGNRSHNIPAVRIHVRRVARSRSWKCRHVLLADQSSGDEVGLYTVASLNRSLGW